jgi:hypothetical protein
MIQITPQMRILVAVEPCDFRKGIDGLGGICRNVLEEDPLSGCVFVFRNMGMHFTQAPTICCGATKELYGAGGTWTEICARRKKSLPRERDLRRLNRKVNSLR